MSNLKKRYSVPARIIELLFTDDTFYSEVLKIKKLSSSKFPKSDEWRDEKGFHLSFALAGYPPEDVSIETEENILIIKGNGIDSIKLTDNIATNEFEDDLQEYSKESRPRMHIGLITRGIARRSFCVKHLISEEFDVLNAKATMEHGLLHVFIPEKELLKQSKIEIKGGK